MIIYCTSITQSWRNILKYANVLTLERGTGSARCLAMPAHMLPKEQVKWAEDNIISAPEWSGSGTLVVASTYELPILRVSRRVREWSEATEHHANRLNVFDGFEVHCLLEKSKHGIGHERLRMSVDGEFLDLWSDGFFNERMEELF